MRNVPMSLSARRAWIEKLICVLLMALNLLVALRKESVDRKTGTLDPKKYDRTKSLSARRAWIEKFVGVERLINHIVALRKESVDRKSIGLASIRAYISRSPQGERG